MDSFPAWDPSRTLESLQNPGLPPKPGTPSKTLDSLQSRGGGEKFMELISE